MSKLLSLLFSLSLFFISVNIVNACSCAPSTSLNTFFDNANTVFVGKVVNIKLGDPYYYSGVLLRESTQVEFESSKVWKGLKNKSIILRTNSEGASCGYSFKENEEYLVFAYGDEDNLSVGLCGGTQLLFYSEDTVKELENFKKGKIPESLGLDYKSTNRVGSRSMVFNITAFAVILIFVYKFLKNK